MATQLVQLMTRLKNPDFRKRLLTACNQAISTAEALYNGEIEDLQACKGEWEAAISDAISIELPRHVKDVVKSLPSPHIITPAELWDDFEVYFNDDIDSFTEEMYDSYLDHIERRLLKKRWSGPISIGKIFFPETDKLGLAGRAMLHGALLTEARFLGEVSNERIRDSAKNLFPEEESNDLDLLVEIGDFKLLFSGVEFSNKERRLSKPETDPATAGMLTVQLNGRSSPTAMHELESRITRIACSQYRSVLDLLKSSRLEAGEFKTYWRFLFDGLKIGLNTDSKMDSFDRRISNAVILLTESDNQPSDAIGLSLCVAALDALLGRRGSEATKTLADAIAALLETKAELRPQAAKYVEKLYDRRSRVLHGELLEDNNLVRENARKLTASVLWSIWTYKGCLLRTGQDVPKFEDFLEKLRNDRGKSKLQDGLLELPVVEFWRTAGAGEQD